MTFDPAAMPLLELNNGVRIPQVGFGVFQIPVKETEKATAKALEAGYRHIDTATAYSNEEGVGKAVAASGLSRDEVFVTTKLRNADQGAGNVRPAVEASLEALGLDTIDLYLMHWPMPTKRLFIETWAAMEEIAAEGLVRAIGVCNFLQPHLADLLANAGVRPAVNQIELHPTYQQVDACEATREAGALVEAYSPIAQGADLELDVVKQLALLKERTAAQVILRWHVQKGNIVIPKSTDPKRMAQNIDLFDFDLDADEMARLDALESGHRVGQDPNTFDWPQK